MSHGPPLLQVLCERKAFLPSEEFFQASLSLAVPPPAEGGVVAFARGFCKYAELLLHERREYDAAIELYNRAFKFDPSNTMVSIKFFNLLCI